MLEDTLGFKGIQTSQILEVYKELSKSMTFELIWTSWHIPTRNRTRCIKTQNNDISLYFLRTSNVLTWFFFISLLFFSYLFYNMYLFACMDMYMLLGPCFVHNLIRYRLNIATVNKAQSAKQQVKGPGSLFLLGPGYCQK